MGDDRRSGTANIYDVAARAGVSIATVSRVLAGSAPVAPATRQRVLDAADVLRWRPNEVARVLAGGGTFGVVGIVFPELRGPYFPEVLAGFEDAAVGEDHSVLVVATHGRANSTDLVRGFAQRVDGLVIMDRFVDDGLAVELDTAGTPVILLARPGVEGIPSVCSENLRTATKLGRHLLATGRSRIAFLGDIDAAPDVAERWHGLLRAHADAGLPPPEKPMPCSLLQPEGRVAAGALLDGDRDVDAVMCANDEIAFGVYAAAHERGLRVPDDLAVTGWDDIPASRLVAPPLTTVHQPLRDLGVRSARRLFARIGGDRDDASLVLPTVAHIRGSSQRSTKHPEVQT